MKRGQETNHIWKQEAGTQDTHDRGLTLIVFILYCKTLLLLLRWDAGKVRDRFGGMGRFKGGLRCKGWVNSVIINVITEINYRCNYI